MDGKSLLIKAIKSFIALNPDTTIVVVFTQVEENVKNDFDTDKK